MAKLQFESLGVTAEWNAPDTAEQYDALGGAGSCVDRANKAWAHHVGLGKFRGEFTNLLEKATGIKRRERDTGKKDDKGEPIMVDETDESYVQFVCSQTGKKPADYQEVANQAIALVPFDPKAKPREAKPKVLAKEYIEASTRVFTNGNQTKWAKKLSVTLSGDKDKDIITLGWALRAHALEEAKNRVASMA